MSKPVFEDLFRFSGRRNRKSYALYLLAVFGVLLAVWGAAVAMAVEDRWSGVVIAIVLTLPMIVSGWAVGAQRCRDFGWSGWAMLLTLVPYIGGFFALAILFVPGTEGPNRYGPDPIGAAAVTYPPP